MTSAGPRYLRKRRLRPLVISIVALLLLAGGGYVTAAWLAPLPEPRLDITSAEIDTVTVPGDTAQAAVDAQTLPTAIGWLHDDEVWSNDDAVYPLGSITKLIMVLVCMEQKPLEPGADGDTYVWTAADAALTEQFMAVDGVAYSIPV